MKKSRPEKSKLALTIATMPILFLLASTIVIAAVTSQSLQQPVYAQEFVNFFDVNNLSNNNKDSTEPQIAVSGDNVYVAWIDRTTQNDNFDIFFKRSTTGGDDFDSIRRLSDNPGVSYYQQIAASGDNVYVVWQDNTDTPDNPDNNFEIFFTRNINGGNDFEEAIDISKLAGQSFFPQIAVSGDNVYVVWQDNTLTPNNPGTDDVFFTRSTNGGDDFEKPRKLSNEPNHLSFTPQIAVSGENVYVVWTDSAFISFTRSTNGGDDFEGARHIDIGGDFPPQRSVAIFPQIAVSGENVYVVWNVYIFASPANPANYEIFFRRSTTGGDDFDSIRRLSDNPGDSTRPRIAASGDNVYVVWQDNTDTPDNPDNNFEIFFTRNINGGNDFEEAIDISKLAGVSYHPQIDVSGDNVYIAWHDNGQELIDILPPGRQYDILVRRISDGNTFDPIRYDASLNKGDSLEPQIAVSGNKVYVVWQDNTPSLFDADIPDNFDVLFKRGFPQPIPPPIVFSR